MQRPRGNSPTWLGHNGRWVRWEGTLEPCESHVAFETEQVLSPIGQPDLGVAGVEVEVGLKVERAPKYSSNHSANI